MSFKKCVVWDLDNTIWDGVGLEGEVFLKDEVVNLIKDLDQKGILHSIASRGDENLSLTLLKKFQIEEYFLAPKINWLQKSNSIIEISKELNIPLDAMVFVDDDDFEIEQVSFMIPEVLTLNAKGAINILKLGELFLTSQSEETKNRRKYYLAESLRKKMELNYSSREEFLKSCKMKLNIRLMRKEDIYRVCELMSRTHQLNTTGWIMEQNDLQKILVSSKSINIYVAELDDKFGSYGIVGAAITELIKGKLILKYLAVSCRVMGRGIEQAIIIKLLFDCKLYGNNNLFAEFRDTGRNRMMKMLYQILGFSLVGNPQKNIDTLIFSRETKNIPSTFKWLEVE